MHDSFSFLHGRLRTCTLRSDHEGQSTLMNLLLRNYLTYNLYDQADKLVSKATFPETASNNEWARYLFYLGKLLMIVECLSSFIICWDYLGSVNFYLVLCKKITCINTRYSSAT